MVLSPPGLLGLASVPLCCPQVAALRYVMTQQSVSVLIKGMLSLTLLASSCAILSGCSTWSKRHHGVADLVEARQFTQRGLRNLREGRHEEAEQQFGDATRACPHDPLARKHYAEALWQRGAQEEAIAEMREAIRLSGGLDLGQLVRLGEMHLERGELGQANAQAQLAISTATHYAPAWVLRGNVLREEGELEDALAALHRALSYDAENREVHFEVAQLYGLLNRPQRTLASLHRITEQFSHESLPSRFALLEGRTLQQLGRHTEAVRVFAAIRSSGDHVPELYVWMAESYLALGWPDRADQLVREASQESGSADAVREIQGRIAAQLGAATMQPVQR